MLPLASLPVAAVTSVNANAPWPPRFRRARLAIIGPALPGPMSGLRRLRCGGDCVTAAGVPATSPVPPHLLILERPFWLPAFLFVGARGVTVGVVAIVSLLLLPWNLVVRLVVLVRVP